jgi:uncharacterized Zn-finger protein
MQGCGKEFLCNMNLQSHYKRVHKTYPECDLKCTICNETFDLPWLKRQHENAKHKKPTRPFACKFDGCTMAFTTSTKLTRHEAIHVNAKQFKCVQDGCNRAFNRKDHLQIHLKWHKSAICDKRG